VMRQPSDEDVQLKRRQTLMMDDRLDGGRCVSSFDHRTDDERQLNLHEPCTD